MAIVQNVPCPSCQQQGYDARGTNMMLFDDGGRYCNRAHHHRDGLHLYIPPDGEDPILNMEIKGDIKYTVEQFEELRSEGKFENPMVRDIALSGMRKADVYSVATESEREKMISDRLGDESYFNMLSIRNLVSRHIGGEIAKFYNVRVGLTEDGKQVARHYYPIYELSEGEVKWKGAKCRNLPKDFTYGHLGWSFGDNLMFGQNTVQQVIESGGRMDTLLLVGGECDAMAAQMMLTENRVGQWKGVYSHVWSPTKGEMALSEILFNKDELNKFKKIIVCFDDDEVGNKLNREVAKLFRGKVLKLSLPQGCKDPNDALKQGRSKEFYDAWWNPVDPFEGGNLKGMGAYREKAKIMPVMGMSWPWDEMNPITYGMRWNYLSVWGAGTGVGKTATTKEIAFHSAYDHDIPIVVIYLEEQAKETVRSFAGFLINKDLTAPPCDKDDPDYELMRDYTEEMANEAIDKLCDDGRIMVGDLEGRKDVESVIGVIEEALARGYQRFIIDNLTAFEHTTKTGKMSNQVDAIDETMRQLGTFKDENEVFILLLSHLKRPYGERKSHEEGGRVHLTDFRGSGSIVMWANDVWGMERDTTNEDLDVKCLTTLRNIKNRGVGHKAGSCVYIKMTQETGRLESTGDRPAEDGKTFDYGDKPKNNKPKESKEKDF